jgi:hypothetical protein
VNQIQQILFADSTGSRLNPEEDNEPLGFTTCREFLDQVSNYQLLEEDSASQS